MELIDFLKVVIKKAEEAHAKKNNTEAIRQLNLGIDAIADVINQLESGDLSESK